MTSSQGPLPNRSRSMSHREETGEPDKISGRRKACNECRQQKLRCDLGGVVGDDEATSLAICSRCTRLGLDCKIVEGFKRTRNRRRSADLDDEIARLREELAESRAQVAVATAASTSVLALPALETGDWPTTSATSVSLPYAAGPSGIGASNGPIVTPSTQSDGGSIPDLTTKPSVDEPPERRPTSFCVPSAKVLENATLSVREIEELFERLSIPQNAFLVHYHPFLPLIDVGKSPHQHYQTSKLLFWAIISSTADLTFMLAGVMMQIGTQMGLHRARDPQDFAKVPTTLDASQYTEWILASSSMSVGCGLPKTIQTWDSPAAASSDRHESEPEASQGTATQERLMIYRLLDADLSDLQREQPTDCLLSAWYHAAAKLHLYAFSLFDDACLEGYNRRIGTLYSAACWLLELSSRLDEDRGFFSHCPFYCYQAYVCAVFVVLKISMNDFFRSVVEDDNAEERAGPRMIEALIAALKKNRLSVSVVYDCLWTWRRYFNRDDNRVDASDSTGRRDADTGELQGMIDLDFNVDMLGFMGSMEWPA
ncbi:zn 2cys6 transcriptional activator [Colletotrichum musicola]|uniref:Zn 2cys6 transcriptional activator n=1 Tax=Colletotrichum musicola TaxID=2175873 RepID=A0A8H6MUD0_9PEZI|nr:zn 2cys6 transcriptional activator [Colletotrichum musicola]